MVNLHIKSSALLELSKFALADCQVHAMNIFFIALTNCDLSPNGLVFKMNLREF